MLAAHPYYVDAHCRMAALAAARGDPQGAAEALEEAVTRARALGAGAPPSVRSSLVTALAMQAQVSLCAPRW